MLSMTMAPRWVGADSGYVAHKGDTVCPPIENIHGGIEHTRAWIEALRGAAGATGPEPVAVDVQT
jgi:hypothetical protein